MKDTIIISGICSIYQQICTCLASLVCLISQFKHSQVTTCYITNNVNLMKMAHMLCGMRIKNHSRTLRPNWNGIAHVWYASIQDMIIPMFCQVQHDDGSIMLLIPLVMPPMSSILKHTLVRKTMLTFHSSCHL